MSVRSIFILITSHNTLPFDSEFVFCFSGFSVPTPPVCQAALGPTSHFSASTMWDNNHGPSNAVLHHQSGGGKSGAWSSRPNNLNQWLQMNFGKVAKVSRVATQGRMDANQWVKTYRLAYSLDGEFFHHYPKVRHIVLYRCTIYRLKTAYFSTEMEKDTDTDTDRQSPL